ncbi:MAG: tryptophan 2,3-dioxygenase [Proteobacteria bacterium]|nr:tryptophan 2,3-dioxygenase [Pseudomonadota bacterium]
MPRRELEKGIHTDLAGEMSYGDYLRLDKILDAQELVSKPPHHDEMLFIIQHQTAELWMKLMLHELAAAIGFMQRDRLDRCSKILSRVKHVQAQMFNQWAVLETLTPSEYLQFRDALGHASGFQSHQFRKLEFLLGNKGKDYLSVYSHDPVVYEELKRALESPSIYEEFLLFLHRQGFDLPTEVIDRDWSVQREGHPRVVAAFKIIYTEPQKYWDAYEMAEKLVDLEENFQLWRFRHIKTVERIIGYRMGTGGSSGVDFLRKGLEQRLFPELLDVRTEL